MTRIRGLIITALALAALLFTAEGGAAPATQPGEAASKPARALTRPILPPIADADNFGLYVNEERLGLAKSSLSIDGTVDNRMVLTIGGQSITITLHVTPDAAGDWQQIEMQTPGVSGTATRTADQVATRVKGKDSGTFKIEPGTALYDNYTPVIFNQFPRVYDMTRGGKQEVPVFATAGGPLKATMELKDTVQRSVAGKDLTLNRFAFGITGVDMTLWADAAGRMYLLEVPSQHAAYIREGYESLRQPDVDDPLISKPIFTVSVQKNVRIKMRDAVELAADVYEPMDKRGGATAGPLKYPVILSRTPYNRKLVEPQAMYYARRGYVFCAQDVRGRFDSQGAWEPFVNEKEDGYDTIEWLAAQPWSTGKVGMIGGSYVGWVQWHALSLHPPHLVTIIPNVSPPEPFYNLPYEHGVLFLAASLWWADFVESTAKDDLAGMMATMSRLGDKKYSQLIRSLPVIDLDKKVLGKESKYWRQWIEHNTDDAYWRRADFYDDLKDVTIPVFNQSGWFDGDGIGTKLNYRELAARGHAVQKLTLGPWGHTDTASRMFGDFDFGPQAIVDLQRDYLRWFDRWLKGVDNGIDREPLVNIFVMGANKWVRDDVYPVKGTQLTEWYFTSGGNANTTGGDGVLTTTRPAADAPVDRYDYDPGDPTPVPELISNDDEDDATTRPAGADAAVTTRPAAAATATRPAKRPDAIAARAKAEHARITAERRDILVYTSAPFTKPYTFAGPLSAVIYASTDAKDTDWFVRLVDVTADGRIHTLGEGRLRAAYRNSNRSPEPITPGQITEYTLDLWQTGVQLSAGSRLRVEVASASFPVFSRNLNTGGQSETETDYITARQTIYHDAEHPSHVLLPVIPDAVLAKQK